MFVSDPLNIIRLSKIHHSQRNQLPTPDLYHGIVIRLILEGLLNQQDAQHLVVTDIPSCLKNP